MKILKSTSMLIILIITVTNLTSCATPYQKKGFMGGFSDTKLDSNTIRVTFSGNGFTSKDSVENNMLRRCAEVTIQHGYEYFVIMTSDTTPTYHSYTTPGTYRQYTSTNLNVYGNTGYATSTATGSYTPGYTSHTKKFEASAVIKMFSGEKTFNSYNAREVLRNLSN